MRIVDAAADWFLPRRLSIARTALLASSLVLLALACVVITRDSSLGNQETLAQDLATPSTQLVDTRLAVLQAQLEEVRHTDKRLLQTVYWALGILAAVALSLMVFSWFTNVRVSERERDQLRQEITEAVEAETTRAEQRVEEALSTIEGRVVEEVERGMRGYEEDHQRRFHALTISVAVTQTEMLVTAARAQVVKGNFLEVLDTGRNILIVGLTVNLPTAISQGLELIQTALPQMALQAGERPSIDMAAAINDLLARLPETYATDRDIIRSNLTLARDRGYTHTWEDR